MICEERLLGCRQLVSWQDTNLRCSSICQHETWNQCLSFKPTWQLACIQNQLLRAWRKAMISNRLSSWFSFLPSKKLDQEKCHGIIHSFMIIWLKWRMRIKYSFSIMILKPASIGILIIVITWINLMHSVVQMCFPTGYISDLTIYRAASCRGQREPVGTPGSWWQQPSPVRDHRRSRGRGLTTDNDRTWVLSVSGSHYCTLVHNNSAG